jgi:hypothetical protein
MKKAREYWVMGWFLMAIGLFWMVEAFWPILPGAAITTGKGQGPTFLGCAIWALPGIAAVFFGWIFTLKANRLAR